MATDVWQIVSTAVPSGMPSGAPSAMPVERRLTPRRSIAVGNATLRAEGAAQVDAGLIDLSIFGCRLAVDTWHDEGDRLWLRFDGGWPIAASVVWTDGERIGCRFDEPIASSLMRELSRVLM